MDTKNLSLLFKTSLLAASMSMVVGCSDNPIPTTTTTTADVTSEIDSTVETAAKDGTIITVADGYGEGCDVSSGTYTAVPIPGANGQYIFAIDPTLPIYISSCIDGHTGVSLPDMSAPAPESSDGWGLDNMVASPVTTMVQTMIENGSSKNEAESRTSELLGLPVSALNDDPVKKSKAGDDSVAKATIRLTTIAKTLQKAGQNNPLKEMAKAVRVKTATNDTLDNAIQDDNVINAIVTDTAKRATAKQIVKTVDDAVKTASSGNAGTDLLNAIAKVTKFVAKTDANSLTDSNTIVSSAANEEVNNTGIETAEITENSNEIAEVIKKMVSVVKADPAKATFLNDDAKTTVTEKTDELKTVDATAASRIKASAAEEVAKGEQEKVEAKVALAVEADVKAELEAAAVKAKAAAEAAAAAAAEAAAAADAAAAEAAAAKAAEEAAKATSAVSSGAVATTN